VTGHYAHLVTMLYTVHTEMFGRWCLRHGTVL